MLKTGPWANEYNSRRIDPAGQISLAIAIVIISIGLIEGGELGWGSTLAITTLVLGLASACIFIAIEYRSRSPMVPLHLFSNITFSLLCYVFLSGSIVFLGMLFVLSLYFQKVIGFTPLQTGLALLPLSVGVVVGNISSGRLVARLDPLRLMLTGSGIRLIGFATMMYVYSEPSISLIELQLFLIGFGSGLGAPMSMSIFLSTVVRSYTGVASGIARATGQIGSAFGVAIFGSLISQEYLSSKVLPVAAFWAAAVTTSILVINIYLSSRAVVGRELRLR